METAITIQNGQVITTQTTTIDITTYIEEQQSAINQYQANIDSLQHSIDSYTQKISETQALIDQASA